MIENARGILKRVQFQPDYYKIEENIVAAETIVKDII